jgi:hypothetical protein
MKEITNIMSRIRERAEKGKYYVVIKEELSDNTQIRLLELGYILRIYRDGKIRIGWPKKIVKDRGYNIQTDFYKNEKNVIKIMHVHQGKIEEK